MSETMMVSLDQTAEMIAAAFRAGEAKGRAGSVTGAEDRALVHDPVARKRYEETFPHARRLADGSRSSVSAADAGKNDEATTAGARSPDFPNANRLRGH